MAREAVTLSGYNLLMASEAGDILQVQRQLAGGANPNFTHEFKWSPLLQASLNGYSDVAQALIGASGPDGERTEVPRNDQEDGPGPPRGRGGLEGVRSGGLAQSARR